MPNRLALAIACAATLLLAACGPDEAGNSAAPAPSGTANVSTPPSSASASAAAGPAAPAGLSPADVCALVSLAEIGHATSFTFTSTRTSTSGDVAVCSYVGAAADGYSAPKADLEYQPTGQTLIEYTKSKGQAVPGLGLAAYYFDTAAQLSVELGGTAAFTVYITDVRAHGNNPKAAAIEIAQIAVPKLLQR